MLRLCENPIFKRAPEDEQRELHARTVLRRRSDRRRLIDATQRKNAVRDISELPGLEESLHVVCRGNFPLWSVVPAILTLASPAVIEHLAIATLGFSASNATALLDLLDAGQIESVAVVASVYFERQNPAEWKMAYDGLAARGQRIVAIRSHAKVIALALTDGRRFAVESSANLRSCRNLEQFTLAQSPELYAFHSGWINDVVAAQEAR
jgi:hypothetical protein